MKSCWLRRNGGKDCLIFLSGWGMGPEPFAELAAGPADVLLLYDYRKLDDAFLANLTERKQLHLLAWSMGVWVTAWLRRHSERFSALHFQSAAAVGGTLRPVDDRYGIPSQAFAEMLRDLSSEKLEAFYRSMFDSEEEAEYFLRRRPQRACEELREELGCLRELYASSSENLPDIFSRRIVTSRDRIFPARNQLRAWGRQRCFSAALPHFPFYRQNEDGLRTDLFFFNQLQTDQPAEN